MSFQDLINGLYPQSFETSIALMDIFSTLSITLLLSLIIFYTYKKEYSGVAYNYSFNISLIILSLITSVIILTISSNLVLSLGMVGALSIVRFRTAIKDPMDIVYLFWSISLGLITGAQLYAVALIGVVFISVMIIILSRFSNSNDIFLLIIHYDTKAEQKVMNILEQYDYQLKSKNIANDMVELTVEVKLLTANIEFVEVISRFDGVHRSSLVSYNGDFLE